MLLHQHTGGQTVLVVTFQHGHGGLDHHRTAIQGWGDEMHRGAMHPHPGLQSTPVGVQAGERRQQTGMDVEQATSVATDEGIGEYPHEAGQYHQIRRQGIDQLGQGRVEGLPGRVSLVIQYPGCNAVTGGKLQTAGVRPVGDDGDNACTGDLRPDDGFHVAATAGDENDNIPHILLIPPPAPADSSASR